MVCTLALALCFALLPISQATGIRQLEAFDSSTPTKISGVRDGSNFYLASPDKALKLSKITITSNGQSTTLDKLLGSFDDQGFSKGWPVNSDLTIATTNDATTTQALEGYFFISTPDMAKDPNFLVYVVNDKMVTIDRSTNNETTLVLLNLRVTKQTTDPVYKSFYNTRVENFVQPKTTKLFFYHNTPDDGYTDPTYKETVMKMIFQNPASLLPTGNAELDTVFFDNIEPVQFSLMAWHIRALGGIKFDVSQNWVDQSTYTTTKETTTGYTMSQLFTYNTTVNFKNQPNPNGIIGLLVSTELFADVNITLCDEIDCAIEKLSGTQSVAADYSQKSMNATAMYIEPSALASGVYYIQYFRIEGSHYPVATTAATSPTNPANPTNASPTTPKSVESTTKSAATTLATLSLIIQFLYILRV